MQALSLIQWYITPIKKIGTALLEEVVLQPTVVAVMTRKWQESHSYPNKIAKLLTWLFEKECKIIGNVVTCLRSNCICKKKKMISLFFCNGANKQANVLKRVFDEARLLRTLTYYEWLIKLSLTSASIWFEELALRGGDPPWPLA